MISLHAVYKFRLSIPTESGSYSELTMGSSIWVLLPSMVSDNMYFEIFENNYAHVNTDVSSEENHSHYVGL